MRPIRKELAPKGTTYEGMSHLLWGMSAEEILILISEAYQVESIDITICDDVCNAPYWYSATAVVSRPACYDDEGISVLPRFERSANGGSPKEVLVELAIKLWMHGRRYLRTNDAFCVAPYTRENHGQFPMGEMRCNRCGRVMDGKRLLDGDRYLPLCPGENCPFHLRGQDDDPKAPITGNVIKVD